MSDQARIIEVHIFQEYTSEEWSFEEFMAILLEVPEEYRPVTKIKLSGGYDESHSLTISYERPETQAEIARRLHESEMYAVRREEEQRRHYEALKRKFGE